MESILWSCNLVALVYLCFWAIRQDKLEAAVSKEQKPSEVDTHNEHDIPT
jgi:hypothetical protein